MPSIVQTPDGPTMSDTVLATLDIVLLTDTPEKIVLSMPVTPKVHQPAGLLHGGVSVVLAETAASMGAWRNVDSKKYTVVGIEINANHLRAVRSGRVVATALPIHIGRRTQVWGVEIVDEAGKKVCISRCTLAVLELGSV